MRFEDANVLQRGIRRLGGTRPAARFFARSLHRVDGPALRATGGRWSVTSVLTGLPVVELTTTGARSGEPRTVPVVAVPDGERLVLVASNYGGDRNPAWCHNLRAHPRCTVAAGGRRRTMRAREVEGEERDRLWVLDATVYPARGRYAAWASHRAIPVVVLEPEAPRG